MTAPVARILVVDDNAGNARLVAYLLEDEGHEVRIAEDAAVALRILGAWLPDLVLMDLQLPGMSGLELTQCLKDAPATSGVVVVALTAYAMPTDRDQALAAGCDDFLSKPIDTREFPRKIRTILEVAGRGRQT